MSGLLSLLAAVLASLLVGIVLLVVQARRARARTPRLPEADGPAAGTVDADGAPLRLLLIGESTVAGVGAPSHEAGLVGHTARALAARTGRRVEWCAIGRSGHTAREVRERLVPKLDAAVDIAIIVLGVNDTTRLHTAGRWRRDVEDLIAAVRARVGPVPIALAGVPPMGRFPALPQPLRAMIGCRARRLDRAAKRLAAGQPDLVHVPTLVRGNGDFAPDGYHPGPTGYAAWGSGLGAAVATLVT